MENANGRWLLTGPTNGDVSRFNNYIDCNFIILGDANLDNKKTLKYLDGSNIYYCVRGMDKKPKYLNNLQPEYNDEIEGLVWYDPELPCIRYLEDGEIYNFGGIKTLILGGGTNPNIKYELSAKKKDLSLDTSLPHPDKIAKRVAGKTVDLVLSYSAKVKGLEGDTEIWIEKILEEISWKFWGIGRFKEDVNISDKIFYIYNDIIDLEKFKKDVEFSQKEVVKDIDNNYDFSEEEILDDVE